MHFVFTTDRFLCIDLLDAESGITAITPSDIIQISDDDLDQRFQTSDDDVRDSLLKDLRDECAALEPYLIRSRLSEWHKEVVGLARQDYADSIILETKEGHGMQEIGEELRKLEQAISEKEHAKSESLLKSKLRYKPKARLNGSTDFRSSLR